MSYRTTAAYLSGGICGPIWWPAGALCGKPLRFDLRGYGGFTEPGETFRAILLSLLTREGGDFQHAQFTGDTVVRVERREERRDAPRGYTVHVWEREVAELPDCADLVNADAFVGDFMGEDA